MKTCPVSKKCGGCSLMGMEYEMQLEKKQAYVEKLFPKVKAEPIEGMSDPYHYRHKVYASFVKDKNGRLSSCMYEEESHKPVFVKECLIQNELANSIVEEMVKTANAMHIEPYDERRRTGVLRHAYLRVSHAENTVLLVIVIGSKVLPGSKEFVKRMTSAFPEIKTVILNYNSAHTSMILGNSEKVLYGSGYIYDQIDGLRFRISSMSFYQVNPVQAEKLYRYAISSAELKKSDNVLDACCGTGTIGLLASSSCQEVIGMEISKEAIADAKRNAKENHIGNASFYCSDANEFLQSMEESPDVVFLDPPRAGFSKEFNQKLIQLSPKKIVYVSCNPETQARDVKQLQRGNYIIKKMKAFDLFPFTSERHVENVILLVKKK